GQPYLHSYDLGSVPPVHRASEAFPSLRSGTVSPDGRWLAWLGGDPPVTFEVRDLQGHRPPVRLGWDLEEPLSRLAFSPDGQRVAAAGKGGTVKLFPWAQLRDA